MSKPTAGLRLPVFVRVPFIAQTHDRSWLKIAVNLDKCNYTTKMTNMVVPDAARLFEVMV